MSRIAIRLIQLALALMFFTLSTSKTTLAANCGFEYHPDPPNQNMEDLAITISSNELKPGTYRIQFKGARDNHIRDIQFIPGTPVTITVTPPATGWLAGTYNLYFIEQDKKGDPQNIASCQTSFTIPDIPVSSCIASIENKPIDPNTGVVLRVDDIVEGDYDIYINDEKKFSQKIKSGERYVIGNFNVGTYTVSIKSRSRLQCNKVCFTVAPVGSGKGGQCTDTPGTIPGASPCTEPAKCTSGGGQSCSDDPNNPAFITAIGCIHTNPTELIKDLMKFVVGISGGLAFLMMLLGAFQMLTSAGNPETLNAGRDRLTSAVIGLLFVIFAILLLQIIGVDILKIPGFGR